MECANIKLIIKGYQKVGWLLAYIFFYLLPVSGFLVIMLLVMILLKAPIPMLAHVKI